MQDYRGFFFFALYKFSLLNYAKNACTCSKFSFSLGIQIHIGAYFLSIQTSSTCTASSCVKV